MSINKTESLVIDDYVIDSIIEKDKPRRIECGYTDNYSQFRDYFANRVLDEKRAQEMAKDILKYGNFSSVPCIREFDTLVKWDGQHVFRACVIAKVPVNYDVYNRVPEEVLILKNKHTKQWTMTAFHKHFLKRNLPFSVKVEKFMKISEELLGKRIELTATLRMLGGAYSNKKYKSGKFIITRREHANTVLKYLTDYKEWVRFPADSKFVQALNEIVKTGLYDHTVMKSKSYKAYGIINSPLRLEDTIRQIQECYNYGRKATNKVDFLTACGYRNAR